MRTGCSGIPDDFRSCFVLFGFSWPTTKLAKLADAKNLRAEQQRRAEGLGRIVAPSRGRNWSALDLDLSGSRSSGAGLQVRPLSLFILSLSLVGSEWPLAAGNPLAPKKKKLGHPSRTPLEIRSTLKGPF